MNATQMKKMFDAKKVILTVLLFIVIFAFGVPMARYYTITEGYNDCVKIYARSLLNGEADKGLVYSVESGNHIDSNTDLPLPVTGVANGCFIQIFGKPMQSLLETAYCSTSVIIEKS